MAQPGDLAGDLGGHRRHGDARLAGHEAHGAVRQGARGVADDDGVAVDEVAALHGALQPRERVGGRDAEGERQAAHGHGLVAAAGRAFARGHDDVGAALAQRLPAAGERLAADAQPRAAAQVFEGADVVHEGLRGNERVVHQPQL
ncbi:hypothetical protein D9M69_498710 [compost metagenome]